MGLQLTAKGADFSGLDLGIAPPSEKGLLYWNYFGSAAAKTGRNQALDQPPGVVSGSPPVAGAYATMTPGSASVDTLVFDRSEVTMLAVCRVPSIAPGELIHVVSAYGGATEATFGCYMLFKNVGGVISMAASAVRGSIGSGAGYEVVITDPDKTAWRIMVARFGTGWNQIADLTRNLQASSTPGAAQPRITNGRTFRVGSSPAGITGPSVDVALVAIWDSILTDTQLAPNVPFIRRAMAKRGGFAV